jgi:hypothetical protein
LGEKSVLEGQVKNVKEQLQSSEINFNQAKAVLLEFRAQLTEVRSTLDAVENKHTHVSSSFGTINQAFITLVSDVMLVNLADMLITNERVVVKPYY